MKKLRKIFSLLALGLMSLCSCSGSNDVSGSYGFSMGKQSGAHFGIYLKLDKKVDDTNPGLRMDFDIGIEEEEEDFLKFLLKELLKEDAERGTYYFTGNYSIVNRPETDPKYDPLAGTELSVSVNLKDGSTQIPPEAVNLVVDCYVKDKNANVIIPVSWNDLKCKFFWEGVDLFHPLNPIDVKTLISDPEKMGNHPTAEQVIEIQETVTDFRDWHTVTLGMMKES